MYIRRALLVLALGLLLAGCSRSTLATVRVDVLSFVPEASRSGTLSLSDPVLLVPDADGIGSSELGLPDTVLGALQRFESDLGGTLTLQGASSAEEITLSLHLAGGAGSPFAAPPVAQTTLVLPPDQAVPLRFDVEISEEERAQVLATIRQGDFRLGVRLSRSGAAGSIRYELTSLEVAASLRAGDFFSF